jgi:putative ABC transport system permease protein
VIRWAWRLFRREWRQLLLVLTLLTLAVATTIFTATVAYNLSPVEGNAEFGTVHHWVGFNVTDWQSFEVDTAFAKEQFGTIDVIGRWFVHIPGSIKVFEFRAQNPDGP